MADVRIKSIFGAYADQLQVLIDKRLDKFKKPFYPTYFDFGTPSISLNFTQVIGRSRIEAAASVIAHDAAAPMRSRANLEKYTGEVATIAVKRGMNEQDYRDFMTLQALNVDDQTKKLQMLQLIWNDVQFCGDAIQDRLDIMVCQALSTGKVIISSVTNPDGLIVDDIDLLMSSTNIKTVSVVWSDANAATMKPLTDIKTVCQSGDAKGVTFEKILIPKALFYVLANSTDMKDALKGFYRLAAGTVNPTLEMINQYLTANMFPVIEIVDVVKSIEKDGVPSTYRPWKAANVSFVPSGKLGLIKNAIPIEKISPVSGVAYATANNALISKWSQNDPFQEFTKGEIKAFPAVDAIDSIFILTTDTAS